MKLKFSLSTACITHKHISALALFMLLLFSSIEKGYSQGCKSYYAMMNNSEVQMTFYDASGSVTGIQTRKVLKVINETSGFKSTIETSMADNKGRVIGTGTGFYKCTGGKLMADMRMSIPQEERQRMNGPGKQRNNSTEANKDITSDAHLEEAYIEYPASFSEGMSLPDAHFTMDINTSGLPSTATMEISNRKVEGTEKITSEAGTWNAYKISYDAVIKIKMGIIGIPMAMKTIEWYVPNYGVVKTETYSKKGKLRGSSLLTKIKK